MAAAPDSGRPGKRTRAELEALPRTTEAPIEEMVEHLPILLERLSGGPLSPDAEPSILALVKTLLPIERNSGVQIAVLVNNKGGAPLDNLALSITSTERADLCIRFGDQSHQERFIGSLDPDASQEVVFALDVPLALVHQVTEIKLKATLRTGTKILRDKEFTVAIRPQDRRHTSSPFTAGGAVSGEHFIGRRKELNQLIGVLAGDHVQTPLVVGIRRIGKTSLLKKMIESHEIDNRFIPIYWSVEDRPDSDTTVQFFIDFCKKVIDQLPQGVRPQVPFSREELRRAPYAAFEAFTDALDALDLPKKILVVVDEFDRLLHLIRRTAERQATGAPLQPHEAFQPQVLGALRKVIMKGGVLQMVFAGLPTILSAQYEDRLFGTLDAIELRGFSEEEASAVLDEAKDVFSVTPQARERLFAATGCQPYLLQLVCHQLFGRMIFSGRDQAAPFDIDEVIEEKILPHESYFTDYVSLVGANDDLLRATAIAQREVMHRRAFVSVNEIARVLQGQGYPTTVAQVKESLQQLLLSDRPLVVRAQNDTNRFRLIIGMLGEFLVRMKNS